MSANQFGHLFKVTTFGESHGAALGVVIDGCPAGIEFDQNLLNQQMALRKPGSATQSNRQEPDEVKILSGVFEGKTLGTPIAAVVFNQDARSQDYNPEQMQMRKGHATDLWAKKFAHTDPRGSGRASGRETLCRVIAGSVAQMFVQSKFKEAKISALALKIGPLILDGSAQSNSQLQELLIRAKESGESYGGLAEVTLTNFPLGLGQPVFHKLKADLASAVMGIGATTGVEIGEGFSSLEDPGQKFHGNEQKYGGIRGGISTGDPIVIKVAFKPTSTVSEMAKAGRHDPCIVPRALPVLEAMCWLVMADHILWSRLDNANG